MDFKKLKNEKGITLIALAVTIVVLLILAGVSLNAVFGENGIIKYASSSGEKMQMQAVKEQVETVKLDWEMNKKIDQNTTVSDFFKALETAEIIDSATENVEQGKTEQKDGYTETDYTITTKDGYDINITLKTTEDGKTEITITEVVSNAKALPRVEIKSLEATTNSITVKVDVRRNTGKLTYSYRIVGTSEYTDGPETEETEVTITGLKKNTAYEIKVEAKNTNGSSYATKGVTTGELATGTITASEPVWSDGTATIKLQTTSSYPMQYQIGATEENGWVLYNAETGITGLQHSQTVYARIFDGVNGSEEASISILDDVVPTVTISSNITKTTKSITVSVTSSDAESGMPNAPTYNFYIKKSTEDNYPTSVNGTATGTSASSSTSYTFNSLEDGISYDVKVTVTDNAKNEGTATKTGITTDKITGASTDLKTGSIIASTPTWSNGTASINLSTDTGLTIQYQIGSILENGWQNYNSNTGITGLSHNTTVYARLTDGQNNGEEASVKILDGVAPTVTISSSITKTTKSITISVTSSDAESGMPSAPTYNFYIKKATETDYTESKKGTGTSASSATSYTFTNLEHGTSYDVKVTATDNAGNTGSSEKTGITTDKITGASTDLKTGSIIASTPTWSNGTASITLSTDTGLTIQYQIGSISESGWQNYNSSTGITGLSHNTTVYARLTDGQNNGEEASITILDGIAPTVTISNNVAKTTKSITVSATSSDAESGMPSAPTYNFYIKKSTETDYTESKKGTATGTSASSATSYTFTNLEHGTSYDVKVTATDNAGNTGSSEKTGITTDKITGASTDLKTGSIIASTPTWSNGTASINLSTDTGLTIQYQIGSISESGWQNYNSSTGITGLSHNTTVYARLTDGQNNGDEASAVILDDKKPQSATVTFSNNSVVCNNSIYATVTHKDNETGISISNCKYVFNQTSTKIGEDMTNYPNEFSSNEQKVSLIPTTTGNWYLHILSLDIAGNSIETIAGPVTATSDLLEKFSSIQSSTVETTDDYGNKVVIPGGFKISSDSGSTVATGIVIEDSEGNQFVWIPVNEITNSHYSKDPETVFNEEYSNAIFLSRKQFYESEQAIRGGQSANLYTDTTYAIAKAGNDFFSFDNCSEVSDSSRRGTESTGTSGSPASAKNLGDFIQSVGNNEGFYVARYEASYGSGSSVSDWKPLSKVSTSIRRSSDTSLVKGMLWNFITQQKASRVSQNMYSSSSYVVSDLMNSYAYDTIMSFLSMAGYNDYVFSSPTQKTLMNTGETGDEVCKIFDLCGNLFEWDTEFNTEDPQFPCVTRGGCYSYSWTACRWADCAGMGGTYDDFGKNTFRVILYIK